MQAKPKKIYSKFGSILEAKENDENGKKVFYIKLEKEIEEKLGGKLMLNKPESYYLNLLKSKKITEEEFKEKVAKIPSFVKYNITLVKPE